MGKIHVKNGTPIGTCSVCETCKNAHIMRGYRETEVIVYCMYAFDQPIPVPFKVRECTNHDDKNRPTWEQMKDLALPIMETTTSKRAGFGLPAKQETEVASDCNIVTE
jgi:hypothetical protein